MTRSPPHFAAPRPTPCRTNSALASYLIARCFDTIRYSAGFHCRVRICDLRARRIHEKNPCASAHAPLSRICCLDSGHFMLPLQNLAANAHFPQVSTFDNVQWGPDIFFTVMIHDPVVEQTDGKARSAGLPLSFSPSTRLHARPPSRICGKNTLIP